MEPTYERVAAAIQGFLDAGEPLPPAVQWSWEVAQIIHAIGRWKTWQCWEQYAFDNFQDNPDGETGFWQRQLNEAYIMRDLVEQGRAPWDSFEQMLDTRSLLKDAITDARATGRIMEEEREKIYREEQLAGNPRVYLERVLEWLNALKASAEPAAEAADAVIPVMD